MSRSIVAASIAIDRSPALGLGHIARQPSLIRGSEFRNRYGTGAGECQRGAANRTYVLRAYTRIFGCRENLARVGGLHQVARLVLAKQPHMGLKVRRKRVEHHAMVTGHRHLGKSDQKPAIGEVMTGG